MIERHFGGLDGLVAVGFSEGQFGLGVQTLHDAVAELLLRPEPVQDQFLVRPQRAGHLLERFDPATCQGAVVRSTPSSESRKPRRWCMPGEERKTPTSSGYDPRVQDRSVEWASCILPAVVQNVGLVPMLDLRSA